MQANRSIRVSLKEHLKTGLNTPGVGGLSAYNVYGENDIRSDSAKTKPYLFLVDTFIQPTKTILPLIVLNVGTLTLDTVELGRMARECEVEAHVFGRNRGERDDISGYLQTWLATSGSGNVITIRDYGKTGTPTLDSGQVMLPVIVETVTISDETEQEEQSLTNWNVVSFILRLRSL